jgi:hypothetical protein
MLKSLMAILFALALSGCSALDVASKLLPGDKPAIEANLQVGDKSAEIGSTGVTEVEENHGTISNKTEGLPPVHLLTLVGIFLAAIIGVMYISFQMGLRTPRPRKYTSEGRR